MAKGTRGSLAGPPGGGELRPRLSAKWRKGEETWAGLAVLDRGGRVRGDSRRPEGLWRNELSPGLKQTNKSHGGRREETEAHCEGIRNPPGRLGPGARQPMECERHPRADGR